MYLPSGFRKKMGLNTLTPKMLRFKLFSQPGNLNLNFYGRQLFFAFKYTGSGKSTQDGTFELDDFRIFDR